MASLEGPTARVMIGNTTVNAALGNVWKLSFLPNGFYQERGGWIYADSTNVNNLFISLAPADRSTPVQEDAPGMAIDLSNPEAGNPPSGYKVVGSYHTHPLPEGNEEPSRADLMNAYDRGVPGIVVSTGSIWYYGPPFRDSMGGPIGYPGGDSPWSGQSPKRYGPNPFS